MVSATFHIEEEEILANGAPEFYGSLFRTTLHLLSISCPSVQLLLLIEWDAPTELNTS